mgnify:CR=1 FL=1
MKKIIGILIIASLALSFAYSEEAKWLTDFDSAKAESKTSQKKILLKFSGSDWCGNCIRLDRTLFESDIFKEYASENLVLLSADFPSRKKNQLSKEQTEHNEMLAEKYNKDGVFPKILVLNEEGEVLGTMSLASKIAEEYLADIKNLAK